MGKLHEKGGIKKEFTEANISILFNYMVSRGYIEVVSSKDNWDLFTEYYECAYGEKPIKANFDDVSYLWIGRVGERGNLYKHEDEYYNGEGFYKPYIAAEFSNRTKLPYIEWD